MLPSCDLDFGFAYLQTVNFNDFVTGTTIPHIYYKDYSHKTMLVPTLDEQVAIGIFFSSIDAKISTLSKMLSSLKQLKTAYLQKMFI